MSGDQSASATSRPDEIEWEFECLSCGNEMEVSATETDFSPTGLILPDCPECDEIMRHAGPVLDECDRCGQKLLYTGCSGLGRDTLCESCYGDLEVMM